MTPEIPPEELKRIEKDAALYSWEVMRVDPRVDRKHLTDYSAGAHAEYLLSLDREKAGYVKLLEWFLLNYMKAKPATPNQLPIMVEKFLASQRLV